MRDSIIVYSLESSLYTGPKLGQMSADVRAPKRANPSAGAANSGKFSLTTKC